MLRSIWRRFLAERVTQSVAGRLAPALKQSVEAAAFEAKAVVEAQGKLLKAEMEEMSARLARLEALSNDKPWKKNLHVPPIAIHPKLSGPFMAYSSCSTADFLNPEFEPLCRLLGLEPDYHRKFWEWVFILHHAICTGSIGPGRRALGFAVGSEPLPSAFAAAGAYVMATDAPEEIGVGQGWRLTGEHATQLFDLYKPNVLDRESFLQRVTLGTCDMNAIPATFAGYDFCWSSCSFEHLGSIEKGLNFVVESVERTLRPGGVACHTTELNLSSNTSTVEEGATVLYRISDIQRLVDRLEQRGHKVQPFKLAPDNHVLDFYADTPPYSVPPHLKLQLLGYVSTSMGLVITRGEV